MKTLHKSVLATAVGMCVSSLASAASPVLEEVVVTAQKRAQSLNDVGVAVTAFTGDTMKKLGMSTAGDIAAQTPGFTVTDAGSGGIPVYNIRGIGFDDYTINSSSSVGVYIDEVALPYPIMTKGLQFDIERVEVLKGPQGDLYGRNNTGGAVNFITNKPTDEFEAGLTAGFGNYDRQEIEGFVSGALTDNVRARLAVSGKNIGEGWQKDIITGEKYGEKEEFAARLQLEADLSDKLNLAVRLQTASEKGHPQVPQSVQDLSGYLTGYMVADQVPNPGPEDIWVGNATGDQIRTDSTSQSAGITLNYEGDNVTFTSITGYDKFERDDVQDWDGLGISTIDTRSKADIESVSQELRVSSADDSDFSWIAGLYASSDEVNDHNNTDLRDFFYVQADSIYVQNTDTLGVYGHAEWQIDDQFKLILGARYTEEERKFTGCTADSGDGSWAYVAYLVGLYVPGGPATGSGVVGGCNQIDTSGTTPAITNDPITRNIDTAKTSGKIGIDYTPNNDWLIYTSISNSFKSGGINAFTSVYDYQMDPYAPEELTAYEMGFKASLLDSSMQFNGALFHYDYKNKQVSDSQIDPSGIFGLVSALVNVPNSKVDGLELELQWRPTDELSIRAATVFLNSEVTSSYTTWVPYPDFVTLPEEAKGNKLPSTPELAYNLMATYETPIGDSLLIRGILSYAYSDDYYSYLSNSDIFKVKSYGVTDARITLAAQDEAWSVTLWGKNILNEEYSTFVTLAQVNSAAYRGMPATYGITASFDF